VQDVEFGPVALGQRARERQDLRVEGGVLRVDVPFDVEQVRLVRRRCGVNRRKDSREGLIPVAGLHEPDRAGAGAEQVHVGRAEEDGLVRLGFLHQQVVPAAQDLQDELDVAPTPEDFGGDSQPVLPEGPGEPLQGLGLVADDQRLQLVRGGHHQAGVPGEVFHHIDQRDRGRVLLRQTGSAGGHALRGLPYVDRDEEVPERMHHELPTSGHAEPLEGDSS
jgi:hypothetical protein